MFYSYRNTSLLLRDFVSKIRFGYAAHTLKFFSKLKWIRIGLFVGFVVSFWKIRGPFAVSKYFLKQNLMYAVLVSYSINSWILLFNIHTRDFFKIIRGSEGTRVAVHLSGLDIFGS